MNYLTEVSIVVIGYNEAKNLDHTFKAINNIDYPKDKIELLYCDTGSADRSVELAKKYTDKVYIDESDWPTPGLARNRGLIKANYDIIHFVDGDIQVDAKYLKVAVQKFKQKNVDAVYGFLEELKPKGINKILLSHWKNKVEGYSNATGGGGTYKKDALLAINGYDERIKKGQETELGERFIKAGFKIWFINKKMGTHNYDINNFIGYIKNQFIMGKSNAFNLLIKKENTFFSNNKKTAVNSMVFNGLLILLLMFGFITNFFYPLFIYVLLYLIYSFVKIFLFKNIGGKNNFKYFMYMQLSKPVFFAGQLNLLIKSLIFFIGNKKPIVPPRMVIK